MTAQPQILHFTIQLRDIEPAIWRRIEVPASYTFCAASKRPTWNLDPICPK